MPAATSHHGMSARVDPMVGERLEARAGREPRDQGDAGTHRSRHQTCGQTVSDRHQAQLAAGCSHRREHPELSQAALGDDDEAGSSDERDEQQCDRVERQRADHRRTAFCSCLGSRRSR